MIVAGMQRALQNRVSVASLAKSPQTPFALGASAPKPPRIFEEGLDFGVPIHWEHVSEANTVCCVPMSTYVDPTTAKLIYRPRVQ